MFSPMSDDFLISLGLTILCSVTGIAGIRRYRRKEDQTTLLLAYSSAPLAIGFCVLSMIIFGRTVYPEWPANLGGGAAMEARFLLARENAHRIGVLPLDTQMSNINSLVTKPLQIIDQSNTSYVVVLDSHPSKRAVEVNKNLIDQVVYETIVEKRFRKLRSTSQEPTMLTPSDTSAVLLDSS